MLDLEPRHMMMVRSILERFAPDLRVWVFGSRVTGHARRFSDLDLALEGDGELGFGIMGELREAFSESDLPMMVDLVDLRSISPDFRRLIEKSFLPVE